MHANVKSLSTPETNIKLYINYILLKKKEIMNRKLVCMWINVNKQWFDEKALVRMVGKKYYVCYSEDIPKYMDADSWNNNEEKVITNKINKKKTGETTQ